MAWKALFSCSCFYTLIFGFFSFVLFRFAFLNHSYIPCKKPGMVDYEGFHLFLPIQLNVYITGDDGGEGSAAAGKSCASNRSSTSECHGGLREMLIKVPFTDALHQSISKCYFAN